ncbi:dioxygenase [Streptomyces sp. NPDC020298]|uniref:dioxygenase family protein n=1 Tax=unclassified Streptomyces TaxID=2593676 RepID=UPI0033E38398
MTSNAIAADLSPATLTDTVVDSFARTPDARLRRCLDVLTRHLHAAIRELEPTVAEWETAIEFLTATGHKCSEVRQEFVLLSDVLGISALVETINDSDLPEVTEATVLGPFHMVESPRRRHGDLISEADPTDQCLVTGRVLDSDGNPLTGADVDVWQADMNGFYDVQQPGIQSAGNGRGLFTAGSDGGFHFRTVVPSPYPIPTDGPVGTLLEATERHPYRPAHIHFIVDIPGYRPVTTHVFIADSPYLDSDAVFAVKQSLINEVRHGNDPIVAQRYGLPVPYRHLHVDLVLARADDQDA